MLLKITQVGQPLLRTKAKAVGLKVPDSQRTQGLIDDMLATLHDAPGVGLAAPQVGENLQIIIVHDKANYHEAVPTDILAEQARKPVPFTVLVNPKLTVTNTDEALYFEGCLSLDGYVAAVPRAISVTVSALDRHGKAITVKAKGWYARILQHEIGHLNGELYIDCMNSRSFMTIKNFSLHWRKAGQASIKQAFK